MSDCDEPCDGCANRATHHLCDACCEEDVARLTRERDEARAEVERLERLFQQTHGVHHSWVDARHKVAERQREACAKAAQDDVRDDVVRAVRATPLVTEGDK